jgi:small-conductance mechanosensitive channel
MVIRDKQDFKSKSGGWIVPPLLRALLHMTRRYLIRSVFSILAILVFMPVSGVVHAQTAGNTGQEVVPVEGLRFENLEGWEYEDIGKLQIAPVVVNGEILFHFVGIASYPAKKRARVAVKRIEALAKDESYDPEELHIRETENAHKIYRDKNPKGRSLVAIYDEDAALQGLGRDIVAPTILEKIKTTVVAYRHDRQPDVIRAQAFKALIRTITLIVILFGVVWGFRRLDGILERRLKRQIDQLEAKSMRIIQAEHIWSGFRVLLKLVRAAIILGLIYFFLNFVLSLFPWTRHIARSLLHLVINPLRGMLEAVLDYIPSFIFLILLFLIARYVLKVMRGFFLAIARGSVQLANFEAEWAIPTYRIVRVLVVVFALVLAYPYIPGSDSEAFKGISILLGVLFSLGSTSMISNIIAGYAMTYRRAFRLGDRVKIGDTVGDVTDRRVLVTHIRTLKNEEVVIPNSTIMNAEITNYSSLVEERGLILHTTVGIGYEVPWRQVEAMLLMAAGRTKGLMTEPKPFVLQKTLADFAVNYELNVYCNNEKQAVALYSELHRNIQDVFNEYGVQIMTPAYERDTPEPKLVPKDQWYAEPAESPSEQ